MRIKFKYKLLLMLCAILLSTTFLVSGIWYQYSKEMIVENVFQSMNLLLKEQSSKLTAKVEAIDYQTRTLAINNIMADRFLYNKWENDYLNNQALRRLEDALTNTYVNNPVIRSIEVGNYKGDSLYRGYRMGVEYIEEYGLNQKLKPDSRGFLLFGNGENPLKPDTIVLFRNALYYGKNIGYCMVAFSVEEINEIFEDVFLKESVIIVTGESESYLYASSNYAENAELKKYMDEIQASEQSHGTVRDDQGKEWLVLGDVSDKQSFKIGVAIPVDNLLGDIQGRFADIFIITAIMMGVLLWVAIFVSNWMGKNLERLTEAIQTFSKGSLDTTITLNSKDEFGKVAEAFNGMTQDIRKLMEDIRRHEREKVTLEIRSLQGQINLHFLFNTLNMIKDLCYVQRATNVEHLVDALMQLLHISMEQGQEYIQLKTELEYINHYIEIYKYKSLYPIRCYIDVEPGLEDAVILKFMIQPIVENALIHGIEGNDNGEEGIILINARRNGDDLEIMVVDNGKGFDTGKIKTFTGIGLSNTDKRIKVHFGEPYGITVESIAGISTSIKVCLPFRKELPDDD